MITKGKVGNEMRFCFIIEARYRHEFMPIAVVKQLQRWGHQVDLLEPDVTVTHLPDLTRQSYEAYVLKTISDGPGLSLLEAAEAVGIPTINNRVSVDMVRHKAVATALAYAHGLPPPRTYFVADPCLLQQIPEADYPLVIKPTNGSSGRGIYRIDSPDDLVRLEIAATNKSFFLAQGYIENPGFDIKLYVTGTQVYGIAKRSPLHPEVKVEKRLIPLSLELRQLALHVGKIFGLDIYGLDVIETVNGPVVVDINDFPSFRQVPRAATLVSAHILEIVPSARHQRMPLTTHMQQHDQAEVEIAPGQFSLSQAERSLKGCALPANDSPGWGREACSYMR